MLDVATVVDGVLQSIQEVFEDQADSEERFLATVTDLQEASLDDQMVFVVRLLLNYLDEERREEALKGFTEVIKAKDSG